MRQSYRWKREGGVVQTFGGLAFTAVLLLIGLPGQAMAQSCGSSLQYIIDGPSGNHWFVDDVLTVKAAFGAKTISGGSHLQIPNFGYGMNCQEDPTGLTYANCSVPPNPTDPDWAPVEYLGVVESSITCENPSGQKITFLPLEANKVEIKPTNGPIELDPNQSCMIAWKFAVRDLPVGETSHRFQQVVSFSVEGERAACDNGLTTSQSRSGWVDIDTCDIDVKKQICSPDTTDCTKEANWYDADTQNNALLLPPSGNAAYRAIITNTGSVDYLDKITVVDTTLNIDTTINGLAAGASVTIGGPQAQASWSDVCTSTTDLQNTVQVGAQCRAGDVPVFANDSDDAWGDCKNFFIPSPNVSIEKYTNGQDADTAPGPQVPVSKQVSWSYVVTNQGNVALSNVKVTDDQLADTDISCPLTTLDVTGTNSSMTCTASGTATLGQYANIGKVTASSIAGPVSDTDPSHYFGVAGDVDIEKYTNDVDADTAPGPVITVGDDVTWKYVVTNTGDLRLTNVKVTDNQLADTDINCPRTTLEVTGPDSSMTCTASGKATAGQYSNIGTVNAKSDSGDHSDTDPSHYIGKRAIITVAKSVENVTKKTDGSLDVTYKVTVSNSGDQAGTYDLKDQLAVDEALTPKSIGSPEVVYEQGTENSRTGTLGTPVVGDFISPNEATLVTGEDLAAGKNESFKFTINFTIDGTKTTIEGANCEEDEKDNTGLTNNVRVLVGGNEVDDATACDKFPLTPKIDVEKEISINGGQTWSDKAGPATPPVDAIYRIKVKNVGNIDLEQVTISDTKIPGGDYTFGPLKVSDGWVSITFDAGPNGAWPELKFDDICTSTANITNVVTATGEVTIGGQEVTDTDSANLVCTGEPMISIIKEVSVDGGPWWDANTDDILSGDTFPTAIFSPGSDVPVEYRFKVANIGTTDLENVKITDSMLNLTDVPIADLPQGGPVVTITSADIGFSSLSVSSICSKVGPVANLVSIIGESADPKSTDTDTDTDPATVKCVGDPDIKITKYVSATGAADDWHDASDSAEAVSDVFYKIVVENTGAYDLENVQIDDTTLGLTKNVGGMAPGDIVTYVPENPAAGETAWPGLKIPGFCDRTETIDNIAKVSGDVVGDNQTVTAQDDASFVCTLTEHPAICENGKPNVLWVLYDGDDDTNFNPEINTPTQTLFIKPEKVTFPDGAVAVEIHGKIGSTVYEVLADPEVYRGDALKIENTIANPYKIPNEITIEIWEKDADRSSRCLHTQSTLPEGCLQTMTFHGSCSKPLDSGDEYGAITIWYGEWY